MVSTIDGKTVTGGREDHVLDLGSKTDHLLMRRITDQCDAVLVGAQTLRATPTNWNPGTRFRLVVTRSGNLDFAAQYFSSGGVVVTPASTQVDVPEGVDRWHFGETKLDFKALLGELRARGVHRLLILGGSEINAEFLRRDLVDELFWTVAPKIRLGRDLPGYAGGEPLTREMVQPYHLVESHIVADEVFLRYRRIFS
ncbi:MAG: RibD family protein [Fimbriimonas sp.]